MDRSNLYVLHAVALWFWISGARDSLRVVQSSPDGEQISLQEWKGYGQWSKVSVKCLPFPVLTINDFT